jgi:hypothetical protein
MVLKSSITEELDYLNIKDMNPNVSFKDKANVFTTSCFMPMENNISQKSFLYLSGFITQIEKFKDVVKPDDWGIIVFYDEMFDKEYEDEKYTPNGANNYTNKIVKQNYKENKLTLKILLKSWHDYLQIIIYNPDKYSYVKLYSYNYSPRKNYNYIGHSETFGSIIRFIPLFYCEDNIKFVYSVNCSHAITPNLFYMIYNLKDIEEDKDKVLALLFRGSFDDISFLSNEYVTFGVSSESSKVKNYKKLGLIGEQSKFNLFAGFFGININKETQGKMYNFLNKTNEYNLLNLLKKKYDDKENDVFSYSIDEYILSTVIFNKFKSSEFNIGREIVNNEIEKYIIYKSIYKINDLTLYESTGNQSIKDTIFKSIIYNFIENLKTDIRQNIKTLSNEEKQILIFLNIYINSDLITTGKYISVSLLREFPKLFTDVCTFFTSKSIPNTLEFYLDNFFEKPIILYSSSIDFNVGGLHLNFNTENPNYILDIKNKHKVLNEYYDFVDIMDDSFELDNLVQEIKKLKFEYDRPIKEIPVTGGRLNLTYNKRKIKLRNKSRTRRKIKSSLKGRRQIKLNSKRKSKSRSKIRNKSRSRSRNKNRSKSRN